jgi:hypothetical protein
METPLSQSPLCLGLGLVAGSIEPAGTGGKPLRLRAKGGRRLLESSQAALPHLRSADAPAFVAALT